MFFSLTVLHKNVASHSYCTSIGPSTRPHNKLWGRRIPSSPFNEPKFTNSHPHTSSSLYSIPSCDHPMIALFNRIPNTSYVAVLSPITSIQPHAQQCDPIHQNQNCASNTLHKSNLLANKYLDYSTWTVLNFPPYTGTSALFQWLPNLL